MSKLKKPKKVGDLWTDKASQTIPKFQYMTNPDARAAYCDSLLRRSSKKALFTMACM